MNKPHLYLDMDGVLADFFTAWAKYHNPDLERYKQIGDKAQREQSIAALQREGPEYVLKFFATLPMLPNARRLLKFIVDNDIPCTILSSPLRDIPGDKKSTIKTASIMGKQFWLREHGITFPEIYEHQKEKYAVKNDEPAVLIDDYKRNINAWNAAGGTGLLYRDDRSDNTIQQLKRIYKINNKSSLAETPMKSSEIHDYLPEAAETPQPGDLFDLELNDMVLETYVVAVDGDDILIEADARGCAMLFESAMQFKQQLDEAKYQGREVPLGKPMKGDVKKSKVYVRKPNGKVVKVNFGAKGMRIKKNNPGRRKNFRARHNCQNPGPRWKAKYWSCRAW